MSRRTFYLDLIERTVWTFLQAFAAQLIASGIEISDAITNMSIGDKAMVSVVAGGVAVLKSLVANQLPWTAQNSASSLPEGVDPPAGEAGDVTPGHVTAIASVIMAVILVIWAFKTGLIG